MDHITTNISRDIFPIYDHPYSADGAPVWEVEDEGDVRVYAAPMSHSVPCVGYSIHEEQKPGRLRAEQVEPLVRKNYDALRKAGMRAPMKVMQMIKDLPDGGSFTFPDGTVLSKEDVVEPARDGRKQYHALVILFMRNKNLGGLGLNRLNHWCGRTMMHCERQE